ncbi:MAG: Ammonia channel [Verrucomicrobia subdivision 3 bacterium]|nr:Ammonia channel [Limisphaerales bacterium]MCS1415677.1 Ammonia channel [Limisphaerales bacterium]
MTKLHRYKQLILGALFSIPLIAWGQEAPATIDSGDTAWMLTSTALVLFMTIPGLALFYGGLVHARNILSVLVHCFVLAAVMTLIWLVCGYSLSFSTAGMAAGQMGLQSFIGGLDLAFLRGVDASTMEGSIPKTLHFAFQMTFFIITPALIVGAFPERIKFSGMLWFMALWGLLVYTPICHMVWSGDGAFFGDKGVFDFAGGIVVHITAGVGALAACIYIGPRNGYPDRQMPPHSLPMTVTGTGMLWVGWYGFNAGSAVAANGDAAMALVVTQISASTAALVWMFIEWFKHGKPSVLGFVTGAIAGLAAITPASGHVGPVGALIIGTASGLICWWASTSIKAKFGYDDSLDVFGVHGVGGFIGTMLVAILAHEMFGGKEGQLAIGKQLAIQGFAAIFAVTYTLVVSLIILKLVDIIVGLRVTESQESEGLDVASHGETGYND